MKGSDTGITADVMRAMWQRFPNYRLFMFDKAQGFVEELQANPEMAPRGQSGMRRRLLIVAGRGFLNGYETAINGDYDEGHIALSQAVAGEPWWEAIEHGLEEMRLPQFVLARTSVFSQGMIEKGKRFSDPVLYYTGYGFAVGLARGIAGLSTGEVDYLADDAAELEQIGQLVRRESRLAASEAVLADSLRVHAALGRLDGALDADAERPPVACDDEGWDMCTAECGELGDLMRTLAKSAEGHVSSVVLNRSRCRRPEDAAIRASMATYVPYYLDGWCDQAFGCVPEGAALSQIACDTSGLRRRFAISHGADSGIDLAVASGKLADGDADLAKAAVRHIQDGLLRKGTEGNSTDMMRRPWSSEPLDLPDTYDPFWSTSAIAYAHGVRHAREEGREVSEAMRDAFVAAAGHPQRVLKHRVPTHLNERKENA